MSAARRSAHAIPALSSCSPSAIAIALALVAPNAHTDDSPQSIQALANYTRATFKQGAAAGADREDEKSIFTRAQFSF